MCFIICGLFLVHGNRDAYLFCWIYDDRSYITFHYTIGLTPWRFLMSDLDFMNSTFKTKDKMQISAQLKTSFCSKLFWRLTSDITLAKCKWTVSRLSVMIIYNSSRRLAAYTRVRSWIHIILTKKIFFSRLVEINESKAIHLHFYAKINGFSLVKKALRKPQNAPNFTIYFKIFRGDMPPDTPRLFWIHILYRLATRLNSSMSILIQWIRVILSGDILTL